MPIKYIDRIGTHSVRINNVQKIHRVVYRFVDDYKTTYFCKYYGKFIVLKRTAEGFEAE